MPVQKIAKHISITLGKSFIYAFGRVAFRSRSWVIYPRMARGGADAIG